MHNNNGPFKDARLKIVPVLASIALLICASAASAQRRPSEDVLNSLSPTRTLGTVGAEGRGYTPKRGDVASVTAPQAIRRRSAGAPNSGYSAYKPASNARLLNGNSRNPWNTSIDPFSSRFYGTPSIYPEFSTDNPVLLYRRDGFQNTAPDIALKAPGTSDVPATQPESGAVQTQLPLDQLVKRYIDGHRSDYFMRGWAEFKKGKYRLACDLFGLAEAVSFEDITARTEAKFALLHASIASQQYSLSVNTLAWLLVDDYRSGQMRDPRFLTRIKNIESLYPSKEEYIAQVRQLEALAIASPASAEFKALRAVVLWGQNDRARAIFYAKELAAPPEKRPWSRLYALMEASQSEPIFMSDVPPASNPAP